MIEAPVLVPVRVPPPQPPVPHLSCAIVRSGTSRFIVVRDEELPVGRARNKVILDLLANEISTDGLGGRHYQSNKVAVMGRGDADTDFTFHFYQVVPETRRLFSKMECSNAATAAAVTAVLLGVTGPAAGECYRSVNLATGQSVELVPPADWWSGDWGVRFVGLHHLWKTLTGGTETFAFDHRGTPVAGEIVSHGNIFVMAAAPAAIIDAELVARLARLGEDFAARIGHAESPSKVLIYGIRGRRGMTLECEATCFSEGQQHHSLPGSGAMALGAFLTTRGHLELLDDTDAAETIFRITHPSGTMTALIHLTRGPSHWEIVATSFETPVRLLMHGDLVVR